MTKLLVTLLIFFFIAYFLKHLFASRSRRLADYPYEKCDPILSPTERSFLNVLETLFSPEYKIFAKIRMADIIKVTPHTPAPQALIAFNRIQSKHIDFLLCDSRTLSPCLAIEIDDSTHHLPSRGNRDEFLDQALNASQIPILHIKAQSPYDPTQLKHSIDRALSSPNHEQLP